MKSANLMRHVALSGFGAPQVMILGQSPIPVPKDKEVLINIKATSLNRADLLQRSGKYPPPAGASQILGLECAGYVINENGEQTERVIALLSGGGYAEYTTVHKDHIIPIPQTMSWEMAGGIMEVYATAYLQIQLAQLKPGQTCLIYAAASGVGQATLQICQHLGIKAIASCSAVKFDVAKNYTQHLIDRNSPMEEQIQIIKSIAPGGVNAVFDCIGQQNVKLTLDSLGMDGKWILYGLISGGVVNNFNLAVLLGRRIQLLSTTLRSRDNEFKSNLVREFRECIFPLIAQQVIKPPVDKAVGVSWDQEGINKIIGLHEEMELNKNCGKLNIIFE